MSLSAPDTASQRDFAADALDGVRLTVLDDVDTFDEVDAFDGFEPFAALDAFTVVPPAGSVWAAASRPA